MNIKSENQKKKKKKYNPPQIVFEMDLETKAGSPGPKEIDPIKLFNLEENR